MKLSLKWLNDFVDVKDVKPEELAEKMTNAGFEVESIEYKSKGMERVFVGEILKLEKHPNADRLQVCSIDVGFEKVQILTAATNVFEGALIPVALDGADLPCGVLIKTSKMRGLESQGMLCSGQELKIDNSVYDGAEIDGIMILHEDYKLGTPIAEVLGLDDVVLDVTVLSNRPDCNSVLGLAREISVILNRELTLPALDYVESDRKCEDYIDVDINTDRCLRYMASVVTDLKICESPKYIKQRLNAVGIRSINNIVDITNYVLMEIGQPMHSFDYDKIDDKVIEIRNAKNNEKVLALNMEEYELDTKDTVIADSHKILAIAGVMGGFNSGINSMSKNLVFESATFVKGGVRATSRKLGLSSDSSNRYEKGVEPAFCEIGLKRALHLISSLGYGNICKGIVEETLIDIKPKRLSFDIKDITKLLAVEISNEEITNILERLDIKVNIENDSILNIEVPAVRNDIANISDIAEEIIRIYGFDKVQSTLLNTTSYCKRNKNLKLDNISLLKNKLVDCGFVELNTFTLSNLDYVKKLNLSNFNREEVIAISNPLNEDLKYMRTNLADSLLNVIQYNERHGNKNLQIFEI
ncbi:MAG: phenylalanine--tRNA ligase subunit beta [Clostridia bacterium]|nr:phenylalanine--tRNA ligase subunit beta [Clostridia bacterium]